MIDLSGKPDVKRFCKLMQTCTSHKKNMASIENDILNQRGTVNWNQIRGSVEKLLLMQARYYMGGNNAIPHDCLKDMASNVMEYLRAKYIDEKK